MIKLFRRTWRYITAALTGKFNEVADPKVQLEQAITEAQDQDRRLKEQAANVIANQKQAERHKLLWQLDQAKMQEQMNKAMASLSQTVGQDVPTFDEVRDKIEARYAKALGAADLQNATVESSMLEIERAQMDVEAQS